MQAFFYILSIFWGLWVLFQLYISLNIGIWNLMAGLVGYTTMSWMLFQGNLNEFIAATVATWAASLLINYFTSKISAFGQTVVQFAFMLVVHLAAFGIIDWVHQLAFPTLTQ